MKLIKELFGKTGEDVSVTNIPSPDPVIEPIVVQAVEILFPDINIQKDTLECILELKERRKGVADLKTLLSLLYY